ncbi:glycoprotease family [Coleofasciculus chthonoplastes PCC 7420]|uniref:Glycoprotease family n=1 Tax=Coleofasciculus chthonoplastes PCC 7420 TaxID=118168 RepID=B4VI58_9CYAN|nr:tRNA (adenosine(37)-N6)-threonylcarbamoyltransferase complex dimerization subunit type 1 TsaB [Coleofasciculus chthonoplastes]EDX78694.1 glycoprotease family [Coleofasciculus chthonoplastes PCC 7420]
MTNDNQYGLALHTTSPQLGLAISNFQSDHRAVTWDLGRDLSTHLHQHLSEFLLPNAWSDVAFIAVAKGPGSFTGTRIGVVTARTLAQQLDIPLFAISTLAAVAWSATLQGKEPQETSHKRAIALQMPARRGQLYTAIYQLSSEGSSLTPLVPDGVMTPDIWQQILDNQNLPYQLIEVSVDLGTCVTSVLDLAYVDWQQGKRPHWSEALPFYGQHPVTGTKSD